MRISQFLKECTRLESRIGELYARLAATVDDGATAHLFKELAGEEEDHAEALELLQRVLQRNRDPITVRDEAQLVVEKMRVGLDRVMQMLDEGKEITAADALKLAIQIEGSGLEASGAKFIRCDTKEFHDTMEMLRIADQTHGERLKACLELVGRKG